MLSKRATSASVMIPSSICRFSNGTTPLPSASPRYSCRYFNSLRRLTSSASSINAFERKGFCRYVEWSTNVLAGRNDELKTLFTQLCFLFGGLYE
ncbi:unnamed protein product [Bacillus phage SPP1]|uniref:Bacteriophage SPP1 complete nucleotide sequence n=1 Tax=Bacillus phage SPP1 TaxID=10724 RepID=O48437_BPSPP|nr:hypothetical protein SPP1p005 [Bacillus phage SPP1]CAA66575.1 unnamed protein product [Bacillus phage SPP1]